MSTYHQSFNRHFIFITPIHTLLIANRKQRSFNPLLKNYEEPIRWTLLRELIRDNGSSRAPIFCCPPNARETKRESREARSGYRITCPRGIRGWPAYKDRDRTRAIERWGIPQDVDAKRERTLISRIPLNSNIQLSLSLAQHFPFETLFTRSWANIHLWPNIANFFLSLQCSIVWIFLFLFTNLIIYIEIWQPVLPSVYVVLVNKRGPWTIIGAWPRDWIGPGHVYPCGIEATGHMWGSFHYRACGE